MAQYIKKVGTTPVRGNGFIVDSFNTNDNKQFNAPSLNAVMERTDNNLLLCGLFVNFTNSGTKVNGWEVQPSSSYSGTPAQFLPVAGLWLPAGYNGVVKSPYFSAFDGSDVSADEPFSATILYGTNSGLNNVQVAKIENFSSISPVDVTLDDKLKITIPTLRSGGRFWVYVNNLTSADIFIQGIKLEKGTSCTDFQYVGKDYGIAGMVEDGISNKIATITGTFITNANGEASVNLNYPAGFSKSNCVVIAVGISDSNGRFHYHKISSDKTCTREYVICDDGCVNIYYQGTAADASSTLEYRVTLYKF